MSFKEELDFVIEINRSNSYFLSFKSYIKRVKYDDFAYALKDDAILSLSQSVEDMRSPRTFVTTRVKKRFLKRKDLYLMALDCDSRDNFDMALTELDRRTIYNYPIESSPGHYWIICDYVDTVPNIIKQMRIIPGVDRNYIDLCSKRKAIVLRAHLKNGHRPEYISRQLSTVYRFDSGVTSVIMESLGDLSGSDYFKRWLVNFNQYWRSDEINFALTAGRNSATRSAILSHSSLEPEKLPNKDVIEEKQEKQEKQEKINSPFDRMEI